MRKKVDERIRTLVENGVKTRHRSMFVIIGDKSRDQIVNLHYMLSKAQIKSRPTVLWCYKDKLELSSHKKKRAKQIKKLMQRGLLDPEKVDPFSLFVESGGLTYCLYKDSERILGNTFGMCILQDFEALTPNLLARTIETVEGGGLIVLLLRSLSSLTSLYTMVMDVHDRFRTESHSEAAGRFNERFLLSLASCKACVVMDDELNILPISSHMKSITPVPSKEDSEGLSESEQDLKNLKEQLNEDFPVGPLIRKCCTLDQGKAVITFLDAILDKTLRSTVALLAARGRGKSAALGLAIAGAIAVGYSNIFVTAPSPENLKTLFEFVCKGFQALEYKEHLDYDVVKSTNPEFKKATVRINIYKQHRQTIQYILPHEHAKLSQVELLVVDEAAAIPLPVVKSLLGPYLVFLSSTVNGYEGTGRSLSLKLVQQLEEQSHALSKNAEGPASGRLLKKIELSESIRYGSGDQIESWLNALLCLDVANSIPNLSRLPPPSECDLYYVNRDTLFSYHRDSELFLQRMMALYVASHYKNSPNDLQLMADAPAHHLFVLLGPVDEARNQLPDILCVIQVCLEGQISRQSAIRSLSDGHQPFGDQIPWKFCEQFRDTVFPSLSGVRIVRIATHPSAMRLGYGSQAVELLIRYYEGQLTPISEMDVEDAVEAPRVRVTEAAEKVSLLEENIRPRTDLPHLLVHLRERRPEKLHYIGVSFGLTLDLFRFWRKHKFAPFYIGQIPNTVTGEHTCMILKPLNNDEIDADGSDQWGFFGPFYQDFRQRFARLLASTFREMEYKLAMSVLDPKINFMELETAKNSGKSLGPVREYLSPHDMKRLEAYVDNLADFHLILDFVPILAHLYFQEKLPVTLSYVQASVLLCIGLQNQNISYIEAQTKLERQQILSLFIKVMKKLYKYLHGLESKEVESTLPRLKEIVMEPHSVSVDEDLNNAAKQVEDDMKSKSEAIFTPELLQRYAIADEEADLENALQNNDGKLPTGGLISVKSSRSDIKPEKEKGSHKSDKRRSKDRHDKSSKRKRT
ncbi:RNA cytidine acetyltransferase 1 [Neltuma alba]|uniref:RNA cytidine acetyltransferase 1 n=1 Tax=Neltuma alba TaxID=207710 RepID=UPI0010A37816|nr:RNA cytidine acetyltransferase 1-like [Prosopis alba]XP_028755075.1 RNA cytidine acetyltransferase 1-like [Prosopis alba]XP_028755076.1 RNA cytidine acetyltransferase 1-like [Prosopis alba]